MESGSKWDESFSVFAITVEVGRARGDDRDWPAVIDLYFFVFFSLNYSHPVCHTSQIAVWTF